MSSKKIADWDSDVTPEQRASRLHVCLNAMVEQLIDEGRARQGQYEGLLAYAVLNRLKGNAQIWDVPLAEIGLDDFDPDDLLKPVAAAA